MLGNLKTLAVNQQYTTVGDKATFNLVNGRVYRILHAHVDTSSVSTNSTYEVSAKINRAAGASIYLAQGNLVGIASSHGTDGLHDEVMYQSEGTGETLTITIDKMPSATLDLRGAVIFSEIPQ